MRDFPGLAPPVDAFSCRRAGRRDYRAGLLARLARALFDPDYADPDGFVNKGRALFAAEMDRLEDVSLSRRIGGLLGNDLGQIRVQFNARTYVVEPVYRDDGLGLWDFGDRAPPQEDVVELIIEAARIERRDDADNPDRRRDEAEPSPNARGRARKSGSRTSAVRSSPPIPNGTATPEPSGRNWTTVRAAPVWPWRCRGNRRRARQYPGGDGHAFDVWCAARKSDVTSG